MERRGSERVDAVVPAAPDTTVRTTVVRSGSHHEESIGPVESALRFRDEIDLDRPALTD